MGPVVIGLDVGQVKDPTALVAAQAVPDPTGRIIHDTAWHSEHLAPFGSGKDCQGNCRAETRDTFVVGDLGRLPLGTGYPDVAVHVKEVVTALKVRGQRPHLLVDATGGGIPVVDFLRRELGDLCPLTAVTITGGERMDHGFLGSNQVHVPKLYMVSRVQTLLQEHRIRLPETPQARALARELQSFEIRVAEKSPSLIAGAFRVGQHDDLVIALGLATLFDPSGAEVRYVRSPWI